MNQLKAGVVLNYAIIVLNILVGLIYTPYMLRTMGQSEYGLYSLVASVISYLTILDLGFGNAVIRYTAKFRAEGKQTEQYEMFGMFLILYTIIGIIAFVAGSVLYIHVDSIFGNTMSAYELDRARIMMSLMIFNVAVTFPFSIFGSIITAYENFVFAKSINIIRIILNTVVMICLLSMGYKAVAMVVVQTIFNLATLIINFLYCRYKLHIKIIFRRFKWQFLKEVAIYSFWIFLNIILDRVYWSSGQFILGAVVGTASVAVFAIAVHLAQMFMSFSTAISGVFLPKVTAMVARNDNKKEISDLFIRTGRIQYTVLSIILFGFITFGKSFINLWAGAEYIEAYIITVLFFISFLPDLIQNVGISILQARNQLKFRSLLYITIAIISFVLQYLLAQKWGIMGCAVAVAGALFLCNGLIMNVYYHKKQSLAITRFWKEIIKMSIVPIILSLLASYICHRVTLDTWPRLIIAIVIFTMLYIPLFYKFSSNAEEKTLIVKTIKRHK